MSAKYTGYAVARCKCGTVTRAKVPGEGGNYISPIDGGSWSRPIVKCRGCSSWRYARPIYGTYKPDHECNAKCRNATGPSCECACGGANHGCGHDAVDPEAEGLEDLCRAHGYDDCPVCTGKGLL